MNNLLTEFLAQLERSLAEYVEAGFMADLASALARTGEVKRAIRLNFLKLQKQGPLVQMTKSFTRKEKMQAGLDFLNNWPEFAPFKGLWQAVPWADDGFYVPTIANDLIAKCQAYKLGLYYLQESSAMLPANLLHVEPNETVADFCAAPGGKSGKLASDLLGSGCLLSNDLALSRSKIMLRNLNELAVWHNVLVNADLNDLAKELKAYFSAVVLDVPCSGEGMIRREHKALQARMSKDPAAFHNLQLSLLEAAWQTLKRGGRLVYSTCTFNCAENEAVIYDFLHKYADASVLEAPEFMQKAAGLQSAFPYRGCQELTKGLRIFPQAGYGEGHFAILLQKQGDLELANQSWQDLHAYASKPKLTILQPKHKDEPKKGKASISKQLPTLTLTSKNLQKLLVEFVETTFEKEVAEQYVELFTKFPYFKLVGESVEWLIDLDSYGLAELNNKSKRASKIHVLSEGIWLGQIKLFKNGCKFTPSHNWALLFTTGQCQYEVKTSATDELYTKILEGKSLLKEDVSPYLASSWPTKTHYVLLTVDNYAACWLQLGQDFVKTLYPKQWLNSI